MLKTHSQLVDQKINFWDLLVLFNFLIYLQLRLIYKMRYKSSLFYTLLKTGTFVFPSDIELLLVSHTKF